MSWISRLFARLTTPDTELQRNRSGQWRGVFAEGVRSIAGVKVSERSALTLAVYFGCVRAVAEDIAKIPFVLYRRSGDRTRARAFAHPVYRTLHDQANPHAGAMTVREMMTGHALTWGNAYAEIDVRPEGVYLWPIHPSRVRYYYAGDRLVYEVSKSDGTFEATIDSGRIFHLRGMGGDGIGGYSVLSYAAQSIGLGLAQHTFTAQFFGQGTTGGMVLHHPAALSDQAIAHLRDQFSDRYAGPKNAHKVKILEEGMTAENMTIPPDDAQLLESRQFSIEDVCRWFRLPPHKVQHLMRSTFSNIESQALEYVTDTLLSWARRWEQESDRKLLLPEERDEFYAKHLMQGLLRGDHKSRSEFYNRMFQVGAMSPNDIREAEDMNPVDGGDRYFVPANMVPIEQAGIRVPVRSTAGMIAFEDEDEDEDEGTDGQSAASLERIRAAHASTLADIVAAIQAKEAKATATARRRHGTDQGGYDRWAESFHDRLRVEAAERVLPVLTAMALLGGDGCDQGRLRELASCAAVDFGAAATCTTAVPYASAIDGAIDAMFLAMAREKERVRC